MTDQPSARDVIAERLASFLGTSTTPEGYVARAGNIIAALRAAGFWIAPWEANDSIKQSLYGASAAIERGYCIEEEWAAMRDDYLNDTAA